MSFSTAISDYSKGLEILGLFIIAHPFSFFTLFMLITLFFLLLIITTRIKNAKIAENSSQFDRKNSITSQDIRAIAGDDVMTTQLDLARAYIEMGKNNFAKKILNHVIDNGTTEQKHEAKRLIEPL